MIDYRLIGSRIKKYRLQSVFNGKALSQEKLSEYLEVHPTYISRIERGSAKPNLTMLDKISCVLNVPIENLISGTVCNSSNYLNEDLSNRINTLNKKQLCILYSFIEFIMENQL